eukprot:3941966-Rhodomonas_salina.1
MRGIVFALAARLFCTAKSKAGTHGPGTNCAGKRGQTWRVDHEGIPFGVEGREGREGEGEEEREQDPRVSGIIRNDSPKSSYRLCGQPALMCLISLWSFPRIVLCMCCAIPVLTCGVGGTDIRHAGTRRWDRAVLRAACKVWYQVRICYAICYALPRTNWLVPDMQFATCIVPDARRCPVQRCPYHPMQIVLTYARPGTERWYGAMETGRKRQAGYEGRVPCLPTPGTDIAYDPLLTLYALPGTDIAYVPMLSPYARDM